MAASAERETLTARPSGGTSLDASPEKRRTRRLALLRIASLALVIIVLTIGGFRFGWFDLQHTTSMIEGLQEGRNSSTVGLIFFLLFAVATAAGFPA